MHTEHSPNRIIFILHVSSRSRLAIGSAPDGPIKISKADGGAKLCRDLRPHRNPFKVAAGEIFSFFFSRAALGLGSTICTSARDLTRVRPPAARKRWNNFHVISEPVILALK